MHITKGSVPAHRIQLASTNNERQTDHQARVHIHLRAAEIPGTASRAPRQITGPRCAWLPNALGEPRAGHPRMTHDEPPWHSGAVRHAHIPD